MQSLFPSRDRAGLFCKGENNKKKTFRKGRTVTYVPIYQGSTYIKKYLKLSQ